MPFDNLKAEAPKEGSVIPVGDADIGKQADGLVGRLSLAKSVALLMTGGVHRHIVMTVKGKTP